MKKTDLTRNYYIKKLDENRGILFCALILALLCTFISYPGIWYSDSYARVSLADTIKANIKQLLTGREVANAESWLTAVPSLFMAISKFLTGHVALYTFAQAFVFLSMTFLLIKKVNSAYLWLQYILFGLSPMIFCVSVFYEPGIGCVTGIAAVILLLESANRKNRERGGIPDVLLLIAASFVTFGYRANAFTILPVLLVYIFISNFSRIKKWLLSAAIVTGAVLCSLFPWLLKIDTMSSASAGFVWEVVTAIQRMDEGKQQEYIDFFDEIGGEGSTANAIKSSNEGSVGGFLWQNDNLNTSALSAEGSPTAILRKYIQFIFKEPAAYFDVKRDFTKRTLGIENKIAEAGAFAYNWSDRMALFGFNDSGRRRDFVNAYQKFNETFGFYTCRPWVVFLLAAVLVSVAWFLKDKKRKLYLFIFLISIFYYGAFLINTQSFELRYFYPSLFLLSIESVAIVLSSVKKLILFLRRKKPA